MYIVFVSVFAKVCVAGKGIKMRCVWHKTNVTASIINELTMYSICL